MILRPATAEDRDAIRALVFSALAEFGLRGDPAGTDADLDDVLAFYTARGGCFDVLVDDRGALVGTVGVAPLERGACELRKMYLAPQVRGAGHGRRLLEHAIAQARARGFARIELETASVLRDAIALYLRNGFRREARAGAASRCDQVWSLELA